MGMFSCCPVCGSYYCPQCECLVARYAPILKFVKSIAKNGTYGDPEGFKAEADDLIKKFKEKR